MLEFLIMIAAFVVGAMAASKFTGRARRKAEAGLSPGEIARKRALERMVDNANV